MNKDGSIKLRYDLIPSESLRQVVAGMTFGTEVHDEFPQPHGWRHVENWREEFLNAAMRHVEAYRSGSNADPDSGAHPLGHAVGSLLILMAREDGCGNLPASFPGLDALAIAKRTEPDSARPSLGAPKDPSSFTTLEEALKDPSIQEKMRIAYARQEPIHICSPPESVDYNCSYLTPGCRPGNPCTYCLAGPIPALPF